MKTHAVGVQLTGHRPLVAMETPSSYAMKEQRRVRGRDIMTSPVIISLIEVLPAITFTSMKVEVATADLRHCRRSSSMERPRRNSGTSVHRPQLKHRENDGYETR